MSLFDSGGGAFGPIGGAAGPAVSGGSPVFAIAAQDTGSVLKDKFLGGATTGMQPSTVLLIAGAAVTLGVALALFIKK